MAVTVIHLKPSLIFVAKARCLERSAEANRREPESCLGQVFNFKLGCFVISVIAWHTTARPRLELKTQHRFCPVSLSFSMLFVFKIIRLLF